MNLTSKKRVNIFINYLSIYVACNSKVAWFVPTNVSTTCTPIWEILSSCISQLLWIAGWKQQLKLLPTQHHRPNGFSSVWFYDQPGTSCRPLFHRTVLAFFWSNMCCDCCCVLWGFISLRHASMLHLVIAQKCEAQKFSETAACKQILYQLQPRSPTSAPLRHVVLAHRSLWPIWSELLSYQLPSPKKHVHLAAMATKVATCGKSSQRGACGIAQIWSARFATCTERHLDDTTTNWWWY